MCLHCLSGMNTVQQLRVEEAQSVAACMLVFMHSIIRLIEKVFQCFARVH